jgi:hypothetical protein
MQVQAVLESRCGDGVGDPGNCADPAWDQFDFTGGRGEVAIDT